MQTATEKSVYIAEKLSNVNFSISNLCHKMDARLRIYLYCKFWNWVKSAYFLLMKTVASSCG